MRKVTMFAICGATLLPAALQAQQGMQQPQPRVERPKEIANPYGAYEWLIGDWYSKPAGGQGVAIHQTFRWGPNKSYIFYTTQTSLNGGPEAVHFEGMAVWNGKTKMLDYLIAVEPGSGGQEQGVIHAEPDGSIVREVSLTRADGKTGQFRQRFWRTSGGTAMTSLMRKTDSGWEPNFPGSDAIKMERRPG